MLVICEEEYAKKRPSEKDNIADCDRKIFLLKSVFGKEMGELADRVGCFA